VTSAQDELAALQAENDALKAQVSALQQKLEDARTLTNELMAPRPAAQEASAQTDEGRAPGATGEPLSPSSAAST
jgi:phage shock protein A